MVSDVSKKMNLKVIFLVTSIDFIDVGNEIIDFSENPSFVSVLTFWNTPSTFEKMSLYLKSFIIYIE